MSIKLIIFAFSLAAVFGCKGKSSDETAQASGQVVETLPLPDLDGDKKSETLFLTNPPPENDNGEAYTTVEVVFSKGGRFSHTNKYGYICIRKEFFGEDKLTDKFESKTSQYVGYFQHASLFQEKFLFLFGVSVESSEHNTIIRLGKSAEATKIVYDQNGLLVEARITYMDTGTEPSIVISENLSQGMSETEEDGFYLSYYVPYKIISLADSPSASGIAYATKQYNAEKYVWVEPQDISKIGIGYIDDKAYVFSNLSDDAFTLKVLQGWWEAGSGDESYRFEIKGNEWNDVSYAESEGGAAKISIKGNILSRKHSVYGQDQLKILRAGQGHFVYIHGDSGEKTVCHRIKE
ncbi:hypothetical protein [Thermoflexibacter ruber]|uniref:Lipoprotein n=1 Tax=Thermoflexibacter ruber TaxID=1003 RepID=A0A1I2HJI3_9BACT|nr:hypothetical protein [Thermoflexibacter ruber]SFF29852.1 hypothetical protein SAMN04488541_102447 [Thermoflexibacter ruber]